jgi:cobalt/nickel transport protein
MLPPIRLYPLLFVALVLGAHSALAAPYTFLTPAASIVPAGEAQSVGLRLGTFDPLTRRPVATAKPARLASQHLGEQSDLLGSLKPAADAGAAPPEPAAWAAELPLRRPGDYTVFSESAPHWDAEADSFVVLFTKSCINFQPLEEGWDEPVGQELEIVPLSRPYGLWRGNLFSGQVLLKGEPAAYVEVTATRLGDPAAQLPPYLVQKVRADGNGIFHFALPRGGSWGVVAWSEADWTLHRDGDDKPVLLGAGIWLDIREAP